jgi:hypothetical protein
MPISVAQFLALKPTGPCEDAKDAYLMLIWCPNKPAGGADIDSYVGAPDQSRPSLESASTAILLRPHPFAPAYRARLLSWDHGHMLRGAGVRGNVHLTTTRKSRLGLGPARAGRLWPTAGWEDDAAMVAAATSRLGRGPTGANSAQGCEPQIGQNVLVGRALKVPQFGENDPSTEIPRKRRSELRSDAGALRLS